MAIEPRREVQLATGAIAATVREVRGYTPVPHTILDSLAEALPPTEFVVYLRLFRLSHGHKRETCRVGHTKLAKGCHLSRRTVQTVVDRLAALGLIERLPDPNPRAASEYRVVVPGAIAKPAIATAAPMKDSERKSETAPAPAAPSIYDLRTKAARLHEIHKSEQSYSAARLRSLLREHLAVEGREASEAELEEATRGMG